MTMKKNTKTAAKVTSAAPARKKLTLKKDGVKDLSAPAKGKGVKGAANYSGRISGAF